MGFFFRPSRAANSATLGRIWLKFELALDIIDVLDICKYEEDPVKNEGAKSACSMTFYFSFDVLIKLNPIQGNIEGGGPS